jgi:hypothetical protein
MSLIKAADDARRLLRGFKAFEEVAAALEAAGTIEVRVAEAQKLLADLGPQIDAAKGDLAEVQAQAVQIRTAAKEKAEIIAGTAGAKALTLMADAEAKAQEIVLEAEGIKVRAEEVRAVAHKEAADALGKRDLLAAEVKDLEARAEKARNYIAKLAG